MQNAKNRTPKRQMPPKESRSLREIGPDRRVSLKERLRLAGLWLACGDGTGVDSVSIGFHSRCARATPNSLFGE
jgi:hypothetical protein